MCDSTCDPGPDLEDTAASIVSVLIPGEDSDQFLLTHQENKGWWLPFGQVKEAETLKVAAQRVASEVQIFPHVYLLNSMCIAQLGRITKLLV